MPIIENPLKNELRQRVVLGLSKEWHRGKLCLPTFLKWRSNSMKTNEVCECEIIHEDVVKKVKATFPKDEMIFDLADFYKIFGDTTRVKILYALDKSELCVCDISSLLEMTISAVSHQLKILRDSNLVKTRREGKVIYYSLADHHVQEIIECGMEHISELK